MKNHKFDKKRKSEYSPNKLKISIISTYKKSGYTLFSRLEFKKKKEQYLSEIKSHFNKKIDFYSKDVNNFESFYNVFLEEKLNLERYSISIKKKKRAQTLSWVSKTSLSIFLFILNTIIIQLIIGVTADSGTISNLSTTVKLLISLSGFFSLVFLIISILSTIILRNYPVNFTESFSVSKKELLRRINDYDYYLIQFKNIDSSIFQNEYFFVFIDYLIKSAISKNNGFTNKMECLELELIVNDDNFQQRNSTSLELKEKIKKMLTNPHALSSIEHGGDVKLFLASNKQIEIIDETVTQTFFLNYFWKKFLYKISPYYYNFYLNSKIYYYIFQKNNDTNYERYIDVFTITSLMLSVNHMFANDENLKVETRTDDISVRLIKNIKNPINFNMLNNFFLTISGIADVIGKTDMVDLYLSNLENILKRLKNSGVLNYVCINQFMSLLAVQLFVPDLFEEIKKFYNFETKTNNIFSEINFDLLNVNVKYNKKFFNKQSIYCNISNLIYANKNVLFKFKVFDFLFKNIKISNDKKNNVYIFDKNQYVDISLLFNIFCESDDDGIKEIFSTILSKCEYNILTDNLLENSSIDFEDINPIYKKMCNVKPLGIMINPAKNMNKIQMFNFCALYKKNYLIDIMWNKAIKYMHDNFAKINSTNYEYFKNDKYCLLIYEFSQLLDCFDKNTTPQKIEIILDDAQCLSQINNQYLNFDFKNYFQSYIGKVEKGNGESLINKNISCLDENQNVKLFDWINSFDNPKNKDKNDDIIIHFFQLYKKLIYVLNDVPIEDTREK